MKTGPLALLPLWGTYSSVVWSCPDSMCEDLQGLSEQEFLEAINSALQKASEVPLNMIDQYFNGAKFERPPIIEKVHTKRYSFPLQ
jgi:2-polyprenyl-6-methoxyphenol hydroxylase-like FAD-dependent oxidoreductase